MTFGKEQRFAGVIHLLLPTNAVPTVEVDSGMEKSAKALDLDSSDTNYSFLRRAKCSVWRTQERNRQQDAVADGLEMTDQSQSQSHTQTGGVQT
ncbi:uncharacterized protein KY384_004804 [Bacidia gigantensis]|uniref:uncharacterized protein n=1 Tax=Bacidia gigantensis TaxID=2732470 RepID=UPI001D056E65|nr:uncharacterized protein KY384_004804 [Bacidia gigantensis]KAG8530302.1 hypothetical protein KY384_004804 [Bacidia gigantensis]